MAPQLLGHLLESGGVGHGFSLDSMFERGL